ncbi:hypothetical protein Poly51_27000 [Rubripirellula tenax]|uniref:Secreted protein n=1 Tax=Rubripirellula tenax TaxID=2528015 RepID=A0A5C6F4V2_9BACT|nr:hypothetical protein Poly51_27000 [Rubripirellula tenax]
MKVRSVLLFATLILLVCQGCGSNESSTVIMPGEDYQLSEQEKANAQLEMEMRKSGE